MIFSIQFTLTIVICFLYIRLSPYFSISHKILNGLEFCLAPDEKELEKVEKSSFRKNKGKWVVDGKKNELAIRIAQIADGSLCQHSHYDEYDQMILLLVVITINWLLTEAMGCFNPTPGSTMYTGVLAFSISLTVVIYKVGVQGNETQLLLGVGSIAFILSFASLELSESFFDFTTNLRDDAANNVNNFLERKDLPYRIEIPFLNLQIVLSLIVSIMSASFFFPAFRLARSHYEVVKYQTWRTVRIASWLNIFLPLLIILLWIKPISVDLLLAIFPDSQAALIVENLRIYLLVFAAFLKVGLLRFYLQSFLVAALGWAELLLSSNNKERGQFIKSKIFTVYSFICVAALQLVAPSVVLLGLAALWKTRGLVDLSLPFCNTFEVDSQLPNDEVDMGGLTIFSPTFYHGLGSFLTWWYLVSFFSISFIGILSERNQPLFKKKE